jgi:putative ABC transport system permease protein
MRTLRITLLALLSHWRRHPLQFFSILTGLWLATALWTGVEALNSQARADYARASAMLSAPSQSQLVPRQGQRFDQGLYVALRRAGWAVSPVLEGRVRFAGETLTSIEVLGIEPLSLPVGTSVAGQAERAFDLTGFIGTPGEAWIAPDTLQRLGLTAGAQATTSDGQRLPPLVPRAELAPGVIVVDIGAAQALLSAPGQVSRLLVDADLAGRQPPLPTAAAAALQWRASEDGGDLQRLTESFHLNLTALGMLAFIVGLFIVHASIGLALEQRRGVLRTLRACGVNLSTLISALAVELGAFAIIGGLAGVISGYLLASVLLGNVASSLRGLYGAEVSGQLSLSPSWWIAGVAISLLGALLAGCSSLLRAARLPLLAIAQSQAWRIAQGVWLRRQAVLSIVLAVVAVGCWQFGNSLLSALLMMGAILLAGALLLPALLDAALAGLARICRGPLTEWFIADSRQQLPAMALALMALLLALSASVGVGSMTEGFRQTFLGWLDQRLSADLYLTPRDPAQSAEIAAWAARQPGVKVVQPQWRTDFRLQGWPVQAQGIVVQPAFPEQWPLLEQADQAWDRLGAGQGVMLSEQLGRRLHVGLNDTLVLPSADGEQRLPIVGVYADYGNPKGQVLLAADRLRQHWPEAVLTNLSMRLEPGRAASLAETLKDRYGLDSTRVIDQTTIKRWSIDVFERTFAATGALNTLTLAVAGIALFISLLTLGHSRVGQLAPLWALGVRRSRLGWLTLGQTLMLACLTVLLAMPLGLLLAWCMLAVVNVQAFGWRLPLYVSTPQLMQLGLLGLLTSLLAACGPIWRLARRQPADLLRQFADER